LGAQWLAKKAEIDAVIAIGCVIMGDTPHFDYICQSVSYGITEVNIKFDKPVIFGVLTTLNIEQSVERAGGKHGNKGDEAAITALKMLQF
jgi:6,7-dimethyl-8-ribityllumazine synthase